MNLVSKMKTSTNSIWKGLYFLSFAFLVVAFCYGVTEHNRRSIAVLTVAFIVSLIAFYLFFKYERKNDTIQYQLWAVYGFLSLFYDSSFLSSCVEKNYLPNNILGILTLNIPFFIISGYLASQKQNWKKLKDFVQTHWEIFLLSAIFIALSVNTLSTMTRLDSNIYYTYLNDAKYWNLSFDTVINFKLGGHQSIGYTLWALIGIYLTPDSPVGVRCINLFLVVSSLFCLSAVYKKILPTKSRCFQAMAVAAFVFNPLILGIIYEINLDLPSVCFYIWVLYALMYHKNILLLCSSLFLAFSKETGILLLFGIAVGWGLSWFIPLIKNYKQRTFRELLREVPLATCALFVIAPILMLLSMKFTSIWRQDSLNGQSQSAQGMETFAFNIENTIIKLKELFILNFSWIFILVGIIALLIIVLRKKKISSDAKNALIQGLPLYISCLFFIGFQFVYITYCHIRYITPYLPGIIGLVFFLIYVAISQRKSICLISGYLILILIQNFYTLDPLSKLVCPTIDIGASQIISTRTFVRSSENTIQTTRTNPELVQELQLTQSAIYNRQYMQFLSVFAKFIETIQYDDATFIAVAPIYDNEVSGMTWNSLFGRWYSNELFYDTQKKQLTDDTSKEKLNLSIVSSRKDIEYQDYERIYLISFPYNSAFDEQKFLNRFSYKESFEVKKDFWEIDVYRLK